MPRAHQQADEGQYTEKPDVIADTDVTADTDGIANNTVTAEYFASRCFWTCPPKYQDSVGLHRAGVRGERFSVIVGAQGVNLLRRAATKMKPVRRCSHRGSTTPFSERMA